MISPDALLSGPRGRRMLLELLLRKAPDDGLSRELNNVGSHPQYPVAELDLIPIANEIKGISLSGTATEVDLLRAVQCCVDVTRHWQEPDGADQVCALSQVRQALHHAARVVAESPDTQWWTSGIDLSGQVWLGENDPQRDRLPHPDVPVSSLEEWRDWHPGEGEWWSAPQHAHSSYALIGSHGATGLWWLEDAFEIGAVELIDVLVGAEVRILEIRGSADWAELCRRYPLDVTESKGRDWHQVTGRVGGWLMPDWARVAADYDVIHLTVLGYLEAVAREIRVEGKFSTVLSGWNPDQAYWLRDKAKLGRGSAVWEARHDGEDMVWDPSDAGEDPRGPNI